jgi:hypothetical protein
VDTLGPAVGKGPEEPDQAMSLPCLPNRNETRKDPRCEHCMVHCGYEPSAALGVNAKFGDTFKMMMWQLS